MKEVCEALYDVRNALDGLIFSIEKGERFNDYDSTASWAEHTAHDLILVTLMASLRLEESTIDKMHATVKEKLDENSSKISPDHKMAVSKSVERFFYTLKRVRLGLITEAVSNGDSDAKRFLAKE